MDRNTSIRALSAIRTGVGVGAWFTPRLAGRLFGLDPQGNPQSPYLSRLFGVRDLALAWGTLSTSGEAQRRWLAAGLACDLADSVAGIAAGKGGYLPKVSSGLVTGTAISAAVLGALALAGE
jgi:hypothetical protein